MGDSARQVKKHRSKRGGMCAHVRSVFYALPFLCSWQERRATNEKQTATSRVRPGREPEALRRECKAAPGLADRADQAVDGGVRKSGPDRRLERRDRRRTRAPDRREGSRDGDCPDHQAGPADRRAAPGIRADPQQTDHEYRLRSGAPAGGAGRVRRVRHEPVRIRRAAEATGRSGHSGG